MSRSSVQSAQVIRVGGGDQSSQDLLAVEEPLAIRLSFGTVRHRQQRDLSVTMRTPGHDFELVLGYLFTEDIIQTAEEVQEIRYCTTDQEKAASENVIKVSLSPQVAVDWDKLQRNFYTTSSCGVCGKASIEAVQTCCAPLPTTDFSIPADVIHQAPEKLRKAQLVFKHTGGLHAAGLFSQRGKLLLWREDIGRHNALDKLIGAALSQHKLPLSRSFILLSGRVSFELVQKALMAGVPLLAAVGAPSSLAVELARQYGMGLLGFVRDQRFNIYSEPRQIITTTNPEKHVQPNRP